MNIHQSHLHKYLHQSELRQFVAALAELLCKKHGCVASLIGSWSSIVKLSLLDRTYVTTNTDTVQKFSQRQQDHKHEPRGRLSLPTWPKWGQASSWLPLISVSFQEKHNQVYFLSSCSFHIARHLNSLLQLNASNFLLLCFIIAIAVRKFTDAWAS